MVKGLVGIVRLRSWVMHCAYESPHKDTSTMMCVCLRQVFLVEVRQLPWAAAHFAHTHTLYQLWSIDDDAAF